MDKGHLKQYLVGVAVSLTLASTGLAYGWSAPVMVRLLSNDSEIPMTESEGAYVIASVEFGGMFTPIPAGYIADKFGRKPVIQTVIPLFVIGWALIIFTRSLKTLLFARTIFGMAMGVLFSVGPVYLGEITEPEIRGKVTSFCMIMWFAGMEAAYCIGPYVSYDTFSYLCVSAPILAGCLLMYMPESPYNLISRGKYDEVNKAMRKLRNANDAAIEKEIKSIKETLKEINEGKMSCMSLIVDPCCRLSSLLTLLLGVVALFGGITVMYSYATDIFQTIEGIPLNADQCTILLGFIYCVLSVIVTVIVDIFGRRKLLLLSAAGGGFCHFIVGLYFYLQNYTSIQVSSHGWILLLAVGGYCIFCSVGIGPIIPIYQGEIYPDGIKGLASGLFVVEQCTMSMFALKLFQVVNSNFGKHVSFWFFSFINIAGLIFMYFYIIETKGKTLAEIQRELRIPLKETDKNVDFRETIPLKTNS